MDPLCQLLNKAGLLPLALLLDNTSQRDSICILLSQGDHPCKGPLLEFIRTHQSHGVGTGLRWIGGLVHDRILAETTLDDLTHHQ